MNNKLILLTSQFPFTILN